MQTTTLIPFHNIHCFTAATHLSQWVFGGVVHRGCRCHRRWIEGLHLIGAEAIFLQPQGQIHHVLIGRTRMRRDEIRNQILLFARFFTKAIKQLLESIIRPNPRLHHLRQRAAFGMLWRDLKITTHVMGDQLFNIFWIQHG